MKTCILCKENKPLEEFYKQKTAKDGHGSRCKPCARQVAIQWHRDNPIRTRENKRKWRDKNKEYNPERYRKWYEKNYEHKRKIVASWRKNNPGKVNAINAKRWAIKLQATPKWLTEDDYKWIRWYYIQAKRLTQHTGILHEVDHIHPLQGKNICGLHHPLNLQILTASENRKKGNRLGKESKYTPSERRKLDEH